MTASCVKLFLELKASDVLQVDAPIIAWKLRQGIAQDVGIPEERLQFAGIEEEVTFAELPSCCCVYFNVVRAAHQSDGSRPALNICSEILLRCYDPEGIRRMEWPCSLVRSAEAIEARPASALVLPPPSQQGDRHRPARQPPLPALTATVCTSSASGVAVPPSNPEPPPAPPAAMPIPKGFAPNLPKDIPSSDSQAPTAATPAAPEPAFHVAPSDSPPPAPSLKAPPSPAHPSPAASQTRSAPEQHRAFTESKQPVEEMLTSTSDTDHSVEPGRWRVTLQVLGTRYLGAGSSFYCCVSLVHPNVLSKGRVVLRHDPNARGGYGWMPDGFVHVRPMHITSVMRGDTTVATGDEADMRVMLESDPYELGALTSERVMLFATVHKMGVREADPIGNIQMLLARGDDIDLWIPLQSRDKPVIDPSTGNASLIHIRARHQEVSTVVTEPVPVDARAPGTGSLIGFGNWVVSNLNGALGGILESTKQTGLQELRGYREHVLERLHDGGDADHSLWGDDGKLGVDDLEPVEGAVAALKAIADSDWEIVLLSVSNSREAEVALRTLHKCGLAGGPVLEHNILFVSQWRQTPLITARLQGVSASIAHRWSPLSSLSLSVSGGLHCILIHPVPEERLSFHQALTLQAKDEIVMRDILQKLAIVYREIDEIRRKSQEAGVPHSLLEASGAKLAENDFWGGRNQDVPNGFEPWVARYRSLKRDENDLLNQARPLAKLGPSTLSIVPSGQGLIPDGRQHFAESPWKCAWRETCQLLGIDREKMLLYDDRMQSLSQGSERLVQEHDSRPFFPLRDESVRNHPSKHELLNSNFASGSSRVNVGIVLECGGKYSGGRDEWSVSNILAGSAAERSNKIRVGDRCVAINGRVLHTSMTASLVNGLLEGYPGSSVLLNVVRGDGAADLVFLLRSSSHTAPSGAKKRVVIGLASVFRRKREAGGAVGGVGQELMVTVQKSANLPKEFDGQQISCRLTVSGPPPHFLPMSFESPPAKSFAGSADWTWSTKTAVSDPERQTVTIEVGLEAITSDVGIMTLTASELVTCGSRWHVLRDHDGAPRSARNGVEYPQLLIDSHIFSGLSRTNEVSFHRDNLLVQGGPRRSVGVIMTLDERLALMEQRFGGKQKLKDELELDIAACLRVDVERINVVALKEISEDVSNEGQWSVEVGLNLLPSASHLDPLSPTALMAHLLDLVRDKSSALHIAATTQNVTGKLVEILSEPQGEEDFEQVVSDHRKEAADQQRKTTSTLADLSVSERSNLALTALTDGATRSRMRGTGRDPAVIAIKMRGTTSDESERLRERQLFRHAVACCLSIDTALVHVGGEAKDGSYTEIVISNPGDMGGPASTAVGSQDKLATGMQHQCAGQLVSYVFDPKKPLIALRDTTANRITWAQVIMVPELQETKDLLASLPGYKKSGGSDSVANETEKIWIADPVLGRVWEELKGENGKVWADHSRKVVSRCHPSFMHPLPSGWKEHIDAQRQIYYVDEETGESLWEHPLADAVIYGVAVCGNSETALKLRRFLRKTGWIYDVAKRLKRESFASNIKVVSTGEVHEGLFDGEVLLAEHCFTFPSEQSGSWGASFRDLCDSKCYVAAPTMSAPADGEFFPTIPAGMAEAMVKQYPPLHYMIHSSPDAAKPPPDSGFEALLLSYTDNDGGFRSELFHRVKHDNSNPAWVAEFAGLVVTDSKEQPWNAKGAELLNEGNVFSSMREFVELNSLDASKRVDTFTLLPSARHRDPRLDTRNFQPVLESTDRRAQGVSAQTPLLLLHFDVKRDSNGRLGIIFDQVAGSKGSAIVISNVSAGGPGDTAGLLKADIIRMVNNHATEGMSATEVLDMMAGKPEGSVRISIRRNPMLIT